MTFSFSTTRVLPLLFSVFGSAAWVIEVIRRFAELVGVFVGIGLGRVGEAEMDSVLVARDDSVDRRVIPSADTP
jgi:hypothetical protein